MSKLRRCSGKCSLAECLFTAVQTEQGFAYISDGLEVRSDADIRAIARGALMHTRRTARILERWLRDHDDGETRRLVGSQSGDA